MEEIDLTDLFDKAKIAEKKERHDKINKALDSAVDVVQQILDDPNLENSGKLFAVNASFAMYSMKERFIREDQKLALEAEKLSLEKAKTIAMGGIAARLLQQTEEEQPKKKVKSSKSKKTLSLEDRKNLQAKLLEEASGVSQRTTIDNE